MLLEGQESNEIIQIVFNKFIKINDQGREIMLADFKLISNALIGLVDPSVNPVVYKSEKYIQAWNLNPNELKGFIVTNKVNFLISKC